MCRFFVFFPAKLEGFTLDSQQHVQNTCANLIPAMGKAVLKQQNGRIGKKVCFWRIGGQLILIFCNAT
jgi:hypothetical protein